jgi:hypothetical protein
MRRAIFVGVETLDRSALTATMLPLRTACIVNRATGTMTSGR